MSEGELVAATPTPRTRTTLAVDLRALGVRAGDVLVLHSSLKSVGWVAGGPVAVLLALQDVLTEDGTLVVPTHTSDRTDPAGWQRPPVPPDWIPVIRDSVPAFDPDRTPSRHMGSIAETLRTWPGVRRSAHPHVSFAAWGRHAELITRDHQLAWSLGDGSPLARAYECGAKILLLGTRSCTSLHLAEARSGVADHTRTGAAVWQDGVRAWVEFDDWVYDDESFDEVLHAYCRVADVRSGRIGSAESWLLDQRGLVDHATAHFRAGSRPL